MPKLDSILDTFAKAYKLPNDAADDLIATCHGFLTLLTTIHNTFDADDYDVFHITIKGSFLVALLLQREVHQSEGSILNKYIQAFE